MLSCILIWLLITFNVNQSTLIDNKSTKSNKNESLKAKFEELTTNTNIIMMEGDFENAYDKYTYGIFFVFTPQCPICQGMIQEIIEFGSFVFEYYPMFKIILVNGDTYYKELSRKFNVFRVPVIVYKNHYRTYNFVGHKDAETMKIWFHELAKDEMVELDDKNKAHNLCDSNELFYIFYSEKVNINLKNALVYANRFNVYKEYITKDYNIAKIFGIPQNNGIYAIENCTVKTKRFIEEDETVGIEDIQSWMQFTTMAEVLDFYDLETDSENTRLVFHFYYSFDENKENLDDILPVLTEVAHTVYLNTRVLHVKIGNDEKKRLFFDISKTNGIPRFTCFHVASNYVYNDNTIEFTKENVINFIKKCNDFELIPHFGTEPVLNIYDAKNNFYHFTSNSFEGFLNAKTDLIALIYYNESDPETTEKLDILKNVAKDMENFQNYAIGKYNYFLNHKLVMKDLKAEELPLLYSIGRGFIQRKFNGEYDEESIKDWILNGFQGEKYDPFEDELLLKHKFKNTNIPNEQVQKSQKEEL